MSKAGSFTRQFAAALAGVAIALATTVATATGANAATECTNEQPYPDAPRRICTGYGQSCPTWRCAYPPGTPGKWDINGHYTPKKG